MKWLKSIKIMLFFLPYFTEASLKWYGSATLVLNSGLLRSSTESPYFSPTLTMLQKVVKKAGLIYCGEPGHSMWPGWKISLSSYTTLISTYSILYTSVADPRSSAFLPYGSGIIFSGSRISNPYYCTSQISISSREIYKSYNSFP
jgi:hypothetical protein